MAEASVKVLGSGDAFSSGGRFQASYAIRAGGQHILMDPGPALLAAMKRSDVSPADVDLVLVSHLHGDHFAGLPFLILEYLYESPRRRRLTLAGPPHLEERTWTLFRNMYPETDTSEIARHLDFVVLEPGRGIELPGRVKLMNLRTPHMVNEFSLAFRIAVGGKLIAYSGDTGWTDGLLALAAGTDLFLCECTYFESRELSFHLNYPELAARAASFDTRRLLLTHLGREVLARQDEVKLPMAHDGMEIII